MYLTYWVKQIRIVLFLKPVGVNKYFARVCFLEVVNKDWYKYECLPKVDFTMRKTVTKMWSHNESLHVSTISNF